MTARLTSAQVRQRLDALYAPCVLCEIRCGAMRPDGERGACGLAEHTHVYNRLLHMGEEAPLVPSYAIFVSGCNLMCSFCSEWEHLRPPFAPKPADPARLARKTARDLTRYAARVPVIRNINFVGGEPGIVLPFMARFAEAIDAETGGERPPLLLNTNGYLTPETLALATHLCPYMVLDYKFGNDGCAETIGGIHDYTEVLQRNLRLLHEANEGRGAVIDGVPILPVTLWVRHLLMPDHLACCTAPCLDWLAQHAPSAHVNVMPAFVPFSGEGNDPWPELTDAERAEGRSLLDRSGLPLRYYDGRRAT